MNKHFLLSLAFLSISQSFAYKFPDATIEDYQCDTCVNLSHAVLSKTWPITHTLTSKSNLQKSVSYRQIITAKELKEGVNFWSTGDDIVVDLIPLTTSGNAMVPRLMLSHGQKKTSFLKASSIAEHETTLGNSKKFIVTLKPSSKTELFTLSLPKTENSDKNDTFLLTVFDKNSHYSLAVNTAESAYHYGESIKVNVELSDSEKNYPFALTEAYLVKPNGQKIPVTLSQGLNHQYEATIQIKDLDNAHGAPYYIETQVSSLINGMEIKRNAHCAFSYAIPSAALQEITITPTTSDNITANVTINAATSSRYSLNMVLYQKDTHNQWIPLLINQTAQWLNSGTHTITITLPKPNVDAPLALGYFELNDYGQMETVSHYHDPISLDEIGLS